MDTNIYNYKFRTTFNMLIPMLDEGTAIPRIIHQTFFSKDLPIELQKNVEKLKQLNPGWTHILYDDNDIETFIRQNYGKIS